MALGSCCHSYSLSDKRSCAFEYARTYAVKFYDCFYGFYSKFPEQSYRPHWRPASERFAFQRVMKCVENISSVENLFYESGRKTRVEKTISQHAERSAIPGAFPIALTGKQAGAYAAAGIDLDSAPPLLLMAAARAVHPQSQPPAPRFAEELKSLLNEARIRPEDIAEEISIEARNVYRHLSGETRPSLVNLGKYEKALSKRLGRPVVVAYAKEKRQ